MAEGPERAGVTAGIRVLIVDDHPIVRQGLCTYLATRPGLDVVGEAADGDEAVAEALRLAPDVVLLDLVMPRGGGVDVIRRIRAAGDRPRVVVLTSFAGHDQVVEAVRAGAAGYLLKDVPPSELEAAIRLVHDGGFQLDPSVVGSLMAEVARTEPPPGIAELTARERQVLALLAEGRSNRELAARLYVSEKTVKTHVSSILAKLRLTDRTQAALFAVRHGLAGQDVESGPER